MEPLFIEGGFPLPVPVDPTFLWMTSSSARPLLFEGKNPYNWNDDSSSETAISKSQTVTTAHTFLDNVLCAHLPTKHFVCRHRPVQSSASPQGTAGITYQWGSAKATEPAGVEQGSRPMQPFQTGPLP